MTPEQFGSTTKVTPPSTEGTIYGPTLVHLPQCTISDFDLPSVLSRALKIQMSILRGLEQHEHVLKIMHDALKALIETAECHGGTWYKVVENRIVKICMVSPNAGEDSWETACAQTADLVIGSNSIIGYILERMCMHDAPEIIRFGNLALWSGRLDDCPKEVIEKINQLRRTGLLMHSSCIVAVYEEEKIKYALQLFRRVGARDDLDCISENLFSKEDNQLIMQLIANVYLPLVLLEHMQSDLVHHKPLHPQNGTGNLPVAPVSTRTDNQQITTSEVIAAMSLSVKLFAAAKKGDVEEFTSMLTCLVQSFQK